MRFAETIFFTSCFIVFYNYAGYAILAWMINAFKKRPGRPAGGTGDAVPTVSFIVAAFNEEDCIGAKLINSLEQDYPEDKIEYIFITDGSTDATQAIIQRFPSIRHLHENERRGKSAALNRAVQHASNDILIFSDANTMLNPAATRHIARHYGRSDVGGVAGEKKVMAAGGKVMAAGDAPEGAGAGGRVVATGDVPEGAGAGARAPVDEAGAGAPVDEVGAGEGFYWKYESRLKRVDSEFYSVVGAAGELFSLRRSLYEPLPDHVILDDFVLSLKVAAKGYRIVYEPEAYAMELPSFSLTDEHKRKVRIAAGGFQAMGMLLPLLAFWRRPALSFLYISHRVLRWTLSPLCFILALLSNAMLVFLGIHYTNLKGAWGHGYAVGYSGDALFVVFFAGQLLFYGLALAGRFAGPHARQSKLLKLPYYFVFMNVSVIQGFFRFLKGHQKATWEKARRLPGQAHSAGAE